MTKNELGGGPALGIDRDLDFGPRRKRRPRDPNRSLSSAGRDCLETVQRKLLSKIDLPLRENLYTQVMQSQTLPQRQFDDEESLLRDFADKGNLDFVIPELARDRQAMHRIECVVQQLKTNHELIL